MDYSPKQTKKYARKIGLFLEPTADPMTDQQNLQQRILNIISNQSNTNMPQNTSSSPRNINQQQNSGGGLSLPSTNPSTMTQVTNSATPNTPNTYINFDNPSVQKALDSLISSGPNLLKSISMVSGSNSSSSTNNVANSNNSLLNQMPNRNTNPSGQQVQGNFPGQSNSVMQGMQNNQNQFQNANIMGGGMAANQQIGGYRHPLTGTQIGANQGQFFNPRGGSGMRY